MKRLTTAALLLFVCATLASVAEPAPVRIKSLKRLDDTIHRFGGEGDNWHMSWAVDDKMYFSLCDGRGFAGMPQANYNSRMYSVAGDPPDIRFEFMPTYPELINSGPRGFCATTTSAPSRSERNLYQFLTTPNVPFNEPGPRFVGAKLIYSPDNGKTWHNQDGSSPVAWETWEDRSQTEHGVLRGGRRRLLANHRPADGQGLSSTTRDGYVYLYAPNGNTEGTMNQLVLVRVPKDRILDRKAYEFFAGGGDG